MATKAFRKTRLLSAIVVLLRRLAGDIGSCRTPLSASVSTGRPARTSAMAARPSRPVAGSGSGEHFGAVVNVSRSHVPSDVTYFDGGYAASRGATTRFISGEFRYMPLTAGGSRHMPASSGPHIAPNVNEFFPDRVYAYGQVEIPGFRQRPRNRAPECVR